MLGKTDKDLFYLKLIDENGEESNYCEITKSKIPFHFYYDGENLKYFGLINFFSWNTFYFYFFYF